MNPDYRNTLQGHGYILLSDGSIYTLDKQPQGDIDDQLARSDYLVPHCTICGNLLQTWQSWRLKIRTAWLQRQH